MSRPPAFLSENYAYRSNVSLSAFAKPTTAKYVTQPLSNLQITVVKQMESVILNDNPASAETAITFAGYGEVNIKRRVHGYKKLSLITRLELSRSELGLAEELGQRFGAGVHALSHAILAVAPLFAHGLQRDDLECDHSSFGPTQVVLVDERAGGSGCVQRLWHTFFQSNNILLEAIKLMEQCSCCSSDDSSYDGGCPGCIHAHTCLQFNMNLSRTAAIVIGKRMLERIKQTELYKMNANKSEGNDGCQASLETTPRRQARQQKLRRAKEIPRAMGRSFVVGRTSWPADTEKGVGQQEFE